MPFLILRLFVVFLNFFRGFKFLIFAKLGKRLAWLISYFLLNGCCFLSFKAGEVLLDELLVRGEGSALHLLFSLHHVSHHLLGLLSPNCCFLLDMVFCVGCHLHLHHLSFSTLRSLRLLVNFLGLLKKISIFFLIFLHVLKAGIRSFLN